MSTNPLDGIELGANSGSFETKTTYVSSRLRELIIGGQLEPGTRIRQNEIAEAFNVSATPVREAIRQLQSEGFIDSSPHMGAQVANSRHENLAEVFHLRALLEARLTSFAVPHLTKSDLAELRKRAAAFRKAVRARDPTELRQTNYRLHRKIWEAAQQPVTLELVNGLWARFPREIISVVPGRALRSAREHDALLKALEAGDADTAERLVSEHILGGFSDAHGAGLVDVPDGP